MSDDAHDPHGNLASGLAARWDAQDQQGEVALRRRVKRGGDMSRNTRRQDTDSLLLWLALALDHEHQARTGHRYEQKDKFWYACDTCTHLSTVIRELEARQYDGMSAVTREK